GRRPGRPDRHGVDVSVVGGTRVPDIEASAGGAAHLEVVPLRHRSEGDRIRAGAGPEGGRLERLDPGRAGGGEGDGRGGTHDEHGRTQHKEEATADHYAHPSTGTGRHSPRDARAPHQEKFRRFTEQATREAIPATPPRREARGG